MSPTPESQDETKSQFSNEFVESDSEPLVLLGDLASQSDESRLQEVANLIQEFAALQFSQRAPISPRGDMIDAVAAGVNFLGEELDASYRELEQRVVDRTAELSKISDEFARQALHDALTGLPNRNLFWDRLSQRMALADRRASYFAVMFVDLDRFKDVNDSLGHAIGDELLIEVARRIQRILRMGDSAARVGGDEFLVLLDDVASAEAALAVGVRLGEALREPYWLGGESRVVSASIGISMGPEGQSDPDAMVASADTAMYEAKKSRRGESVLYGIGRRD